MVQNFCSCYVTKVEVVNLQMLKEKTWNQLGIRSGWIISGKMSKLPLFDFQIQVLVSICVCLSSASFSVNRAITSAVIFAFEKNSDDQIKMTLEEASWLRKRNTILDSWQAKIAPEAFGTRKFQIKRYFNIIPCKNWHIG